MDSGERTATSIPGSLDWDEFLTLTAEYMLDHAEKHNIAGLGTMPPCDLPTRNIK